MRDIEQEYEQNTGGSPYQSVPDFRYVTYLETEIRDLRARNARLCADLDTARLRTSPAENVQASPERSLPHQQEPNIPEQARTQEAPPMEERRGPQTEERAEPVQDTERVEALNPRQAIRDPRQCPECGALSRGYGNSEGVIRGMCPAGHGMWTISLTDMNEARERISDEDLARMVAQAHPENTEQAR